MYHKIVIVSGGSITDDFAKLWITQYQPDYIIAADSGMEFLQRVELMPDMIVGDFDSVRPETLAYFKEKQGIIRKQLNPVKDDTDTEFAIREAIKLGAEKITILGGTGTRLDHVFGNAALLGIGLKENADIQLVDAHNRIRMIDKSIKLIKTEQFGSFVSLLPYAGEVKGVTLKGFKYPLEKHTMGSFSSLGISNEIVEEEAEILFEEGILLLIESRE